MDKRSLRVLTYNIHKGFSTGNTRFVLGTIREAIRRVDADLVLLQEVLGNHDGHQHSFENWIQAPQFEYLADKLWPHHAYGKNAVYSEGHHGNAILSKYPVTFSENIDISNHRFEKRGILHAQIEIPGRKSPLHAISVHMGLFEVDRQEQVKKLCSRIDSHVKPTETLIIGGDFNDWRGRATPALARRLALAEAFHATTGNHARTFPSWLPALRLDRVYYRGHGMKVETAKVLTGAPWNDLSDHAALLVELKF